MNIYTTLAIWLTVIIFAITVVISYVIHLLTELVLTDAWYIVTLIVVGTIIINLIVQEFHDAIKERTEE